MQSNKIEFVQALRGIAALLVVLRHCWEYIGNNAASPIGKVLFMPGGSMGVDLFFIISGFIMVCATWDQRGSAYDVIEFFIKRFARIFPAYVAIMLVEVFVLHGGFSFFRSEVNLASMMKALAFLPQGDIKTPPYYGVAPLGVSWTLNYEMYFYLIFGASMLFGRLRWLALAGVAALTLIVFPYVSRGEFSTGVYVAYNYSPFFLNLITNPIVWLFMAGVAIGIAYRSTFTFRNVTLLRAAAIFSFALVVWQYLSEYRMDHGIFAWGLSLVPFMLCLSLANKAMPINVPRCLIYLGNISFSLYLVHISVLVVIVRLLGHFHAPVDGVASYVLVPMTSIAAAMVSHHYLEGHVSEVVRRWLAANILRVRQSRANVGAGVN